MHLQNSPEVRPSHFGGLHRKRHHLPAANRVPLFLRSANGQKVALLLCKISTAYHRDQYHRDDVRLHDGGWYERQLGEGLLVNIS